MPLVPVARPAAADPRLSGVRFAMKDGCRDVSVLVSRPALDRFRTGATTPDRDRQFQAFKLNRRFFERLASEKFDTGRVEEDGSVRIGARDLAK